MNSEQPNQLLSLDRMELNLKLNLRIKNNFSLKLIITKIQIEFSCPIKIKSTKILSLPLSYVISCQECDSEKIKNSFILTFFYPKNMSKKYFDIGKLEFSLNNNVDDQLNEFQSAFDICQFISQYLIISQNDNEKPYLMLLNPQSGTHKGLNIYKRCISELFNQRGIKYELLVTEKPLHARTMMKTCDSLTKYRGILTISGDGLISEVICGIADRESWKEDFYTVPIGAIPAGSGNGLAACTAAFSGVNPMGNILLHNTLLLANPTVQSLDLMKVQTLTGKQFPSFLSVTWGLMAHVDVGSDKLRWMGPLRFKVMAAIQIAKMNKYKGKLWYLPTNADNVDAGVSETAQDNEENDVEHISFSNSKFRYLPDISQPIPSDDKWVLLDQSFVTVIVSLLPYLATDVKIAPNAQMNDGRIHIIIINPDISRSVLLNSISKLETGGHFISDSIRCIECVAFRLVPECDKCYMAVDGEFQENTAIQAEIMASAAKTFTGPSANGEIFFK